MHLHALPSDTWVLLRQPTIIADSATPPTTQDVLLGEGKIHAIGTDLTAPEGINPIEIQARDKLLLPSLFDLHVHAREPGQEAKETIATCADAALNGGVTGIVLMPNTLPPIDNAAQVRSILEKGKNTPIDILTSGCITQGRKGQNFAAIGEMLDAGAVFFTDDGSPIEDSGLMLRIMRYTRDIDIILASHCETSNITAGGSMNEGTTSYAIGITGIPAVGEELSISHDCMLAEATGARLHIQHISSARGVEIIRYFKSRGVSITCEITPHHLLFCDQDIAHFDTHYKMNPPLRTARDRDALLAALHDGIFDVIATDHAPHTPFEKKLPFADAPFGITGLETALISLFDHFITSGKITWPQLIRLYSEAPRQLLNRPAVKIQPGTPAELLLFDPHATTTFTPQYMRSKSTNTPFLDRTLHGAIDLVATPRAIHRRQTTTPA